MKMRLTNELNCRVCKREVVALQAPEMINCDGVGIGQAIQDDAKATLVQWNGLMAEHKELLSQIATHVEKDVDVSVKQNFRNRWNVQSFDFSNMKQI